MVAGDLLVVVADPVDCDAVAEVLGAALHHSHKREDAEDIERRKYGEGEDIEGRADLRCLADEPQRDQSAGDRENVERGAGGALARGLRAGALEREVLGGQSGQELLAIGRLRHLTNVPTPPYRLTVTRKKLAGIDVASSLVFCSSNRASSSSWSSASRPFAAAASNAFMVGP